MEGTETTGPLDAVRMVDVAEAAKIMRVSERKIRRLCWKGELDSVKVGRSVRIPLIALAEYIETHRNGHGDAA